MVRGILARFDFVKAESIRWSDQPVWRLTGQWKPRELVKLLPDQKEAIESGQAADLDKLRQHLPGRVVVFLLMQEAPLLFRVEYHRAVTERGDEPDAPTSKAIATLQLHDVDLNVPIDPNRFIYNPGQLMFEDRTEAFLKSLGTKE